MDISVIKAIITNIIVDVINKDYLKIYVNDYEKRLTVEELKNGFEDYQGVISGFPGRAFDFMRLYRNTDVYCDVDFPLWYNNERSDLTMVLNIKEINNQYRYSIEDILVQ